MRVLSRQWQMSEHVSSDAATLDEISKQRFRNVLFLVTCVASPHRIQSQHTWWCQWVKRDKWNEIHQTATGRFSVFLCLSSCASRTSQHSVTQLQLKKNSVWSSLLTSYSLWPFWPFFPFAPHPTVKGSLCWSLMMHSAKNMAWALMFVALYKSHWWSYATGGIKHLFKSVRDTKGGCSVKDCG